MRRAKSWGEASEGQNSRSGGRVSFQEKDRPPLVKDGFTPKIQEREMEN